MGSAIREALSVSNEAPLTCRTWLAIGEQPIANHVRFGYRQPAMLSAKPDSLACAIRTHL